MASKKKGQLSKYCRIYQWIESKDPAFAEAIRDLCLEGALSPGGRSPGVTFLYPAETSYRQEIVDKAYSDNADEAARLIESLIIPDLFAQSSDFSRRAGTRAGIALKVEKIGDKNITFTNGLTISPAKFGSLGDRRIAVWTIEKGRSPLEGDAYTPPRVVRDSNPRLGGRCDNGPAERARLAAAVEAEFDACMQSGRGSVCNPYLAKVVSLLNYLRAEHPRVLEVVLPVLDFEPIISFYLLLEPYKTKRNDYLIPNDVLFGDDAWNCADAYGNAVSEYSGYFGAPSGGSLPLPCMYPDRGAVASQVDTLRAAIVNNKNIRDIPAGVKSAYDTLSSQNSIAGMSPIMYPAAHAAIAAPINKKLWQDEFRFIIFEALQTMRAYPYESETFRTIVQDIKMARPGNDYVGETILTNPDDFKRDVAPRNEYYLLGKFVNSSDFLYLPMPTEMAGKSWGGEVGSMEDASDWSMYNRNSVALEGLRRYTGMTRTEGISPQALQELRIYAKTHGSLPSAVMALAPAPAAVAPLTMPSVVTEASAS